ncbi:uncharacterized protein DNG_01228 [Cephalotrichum gorgonifer]|uniref:DUF952 domain-containing protein n=1 Tax=Cephalotrichum gorgonifer TaxID=2041049 RepID=A0AAE8MQ52_9PEZI|nr:uncharacterized protein DNG_01228 [Cephalotrichum gorgonifer]
MAAPNPLPTYVYKILDAPPKDPLPGELPLSELDKQDGFIHLSTANQVANTANLFFDGYPSLWVLRVPLARLADVRWEGGDAAGRAFPHLFGGKLGEEEVESVKELKRPGGGWAGLEDEWLQ